MPKRTRAIEEEIPPSMNKKQGRHAFFVMAEKGKKLLENRPIPEAAFNTWFDSTIESELFIFFFCAVCCLIS
jgi:hypothetical protein